MSWLEEQFAFYGSYHSNKWNKVIHFFFVPSIVWSLLVWLAYTGPLVSTPDLGLPSSFQSLLVANGAFVLVAAYSIYYVFIEAFLGLTWALFMGLPLWISATLFQQQVEHAAWWALGVQILSWYMQIHPGHAILEGRKPALLDSLLQAFATAPLFVWTELVFALGYRPKLHARIEARIQEKLAQFRAEKELKGSLLNNPQQQDAAEPTTAR